MKPTKKTLKQLTESIVLAVNPLRIILFGSAARGEMGPNSDIDLLVVMPEGTHRRHTAQKLYKEIRGVKTPFDLVVATPEDLEKYKDNCALVYKWALQEGRVVYDS